MILWRFGQRGEDDHDDDGEAQALGTDKYEDHDTLNHKTEGLLQEVAAHMPIWALSLSKNNSPTPHTNRFIQLKRKAMTKANLGVDVAGDSIVLGELNVKSAHVLDKETFWVPSP